MVSIGVLALQGNFAKHLAILSQLNVVTREVRKPDDLHGLSGLIIPGGESSTLLKLMAPLQFLDHIRVFYDQGGAIFGTCAGLILLAKNVSPVQKSLGFLNISVSRNAYGRQCDSFVGEGKLDSSLGATSLNMVFIRAPKISRIDANVEVLARCNDEISAVRQGRVIGAAFHPEMGNDTRLHDYFLRVACGANLKPTFQAERV